VGREGEWEGKGKLVGWDKDSSTDWQRERKITTIILIRRTYRVQCSHCTVLGLLLSSKSPCSRQLPT